MPILEAHHDLGHAIEDDPNWSESYYFNAYAPETATGFFARIAIRPHEPHVDGFITLWLPDGGSARIGDSSSGDMPDPGNPAVGSVRFERLAAMSAWRVSGAGISADGRKLDVDATFHALTPAIGVDAGHARNADAAGNAVVNSLASGHFEQAGRWEGAVFVDGVRHALSGRGNRDKSWGPRRTDGARGMHYWRWFSMNFGDDLHLGGIRVGTAAGDLQRGWLYRAGRHTSLRELAIKTTLDADGLRQRRIELVAREKGGAAHTITGEVLRVVPLIARGHEHMAIFEGLTRWTYAGVTGYGISEYAHHLDSSGRPVVAID